MIGTRQSSVHQQSFVYTPPACCQYSSTARKPGPSHSPTGSAWIHSIHHVNDEYSTSAGAIMFSMMKSYITGLLPASFIVQKQRLGLMMIMMFLNRTNEYA